MHTRGRKGHARKGKQSARKGTHHADPYAAGSGPQHDQAAVNYWLARVDALLAKYTPTQRRVLGKVLPDLANPSSGGWERGAINSVDAITKKWGREPSEWPAPPLPPRVVPVTGSTDAALA